MRDPALGCLPISDRKPKKLGGIGRRDLSYSVDGQLLQCSDLGGDQGHICGFIAAAAVRVWSQVGAIRLDQHVAQRQLTYQSVQASRVLKSHGAGYRDVETHSDGLESHVQIAREAVKNPTQILSSVSQDGHCVRMRLSIVDDQGFAHASSQFQLSQKGLSLLVWGRQIPVKVQTDLTNGENGFVLAESPQLGKSARRDLRCIVRVYAYGSIDA